MLRLAEPSLNCESEEFHHHRCSTTSIWSKIFADCRTQLPTKILNLPWLPSAFLSSLFLSFLSLSAFASFNFSAFLGALEETIIALKKGQVLPAHAHHERIKQMYSWDEVADRTMHVSLHNAVSFFFC